MAEQPLPDTEADLLEALSHAWRTRLDHYDQPDSRALADEHIDKLLAQLADLHRADAC